MKSSNLTVYSVDKGHCQTVVLYRHFCIVILLQRRKRLIISVYFKRLFRFCFQVLAPALNDNLLFHAFFIYTNHDQEWAHNVIEKLEAPRLGFKCCCPDRDLGTGLTQPQVTYTDLSFEYN